MKPATKEDLVEVRDTVRALVEEWLTAGKFTPSCDSWLRHYDLSFTKAMAGRGLIGISWPQEFGGGGRSGLARLVVTEELLRAGAPVAAHWMADRQIGPSILQHGSRVAKERYLPGITSGEVTFCLGMSETESGSDLASVRTTAIRTEGGCRSPVARSGPARRTGPRTPTCWLAPVRAKATTMGSPSSSST